MVIQRIHQDSQAISSSRFEFQIDTYKVSNVAANAFLLLALADIVLRLGLSLSSLGFFAAPVAWMLSGGVLLISVIFIGGSYYLKEKNKQKNYHDELKLNQMKKAAINLSFDGLLKEHAPEELVNFIFNQEKGALSLTALKEKFIVVAADTNDFESFNRTYDLKKLVEQGIAPQCFINYLQNLQNQMDEAQEKYLKTINVLEKTYPIRLQPIERGVTSIYDFFLDPYKIVRTCIYYAITSSEKRQDQETRFKRGKSAAEALLKTTSAKLQQEYTANYRNYLSEEKLTASL
jgi:hypothetical protein